MSKSLSQRSSSWHTENRKWSKASVWGKAAKSWRRWWKGKALDKTEASE